MFDSPQTWLYQDIDGAIRHGGPLPAAILAGSFNPLHRGHRGLAGAAARILQLPVAFEISIVNVDKADLPDDVVRRRLRQFVGVGPVYLTRAPTFALKAELFPGSVMVVGCDTAVRIVDPRYYGGDPARRDESLRAIRDRGCRLLVAGRAEPSGRFLQLDDIELPRELENLFTAIQEVDFREDVSSTESRRQA